MMEKKGIEKGLIETIKEIYEETSNVVRCGEALSGEFWIREGVRQECVLS